ncbi:MAG TPA: hypothetical protein VMZ28_16145 [Kofleriaceae bacterium]|nr:hypothetical protein [Kofleriaceae bacterium]
MKIVHLGLLALVCLPRSASADDPHAEVMAAADRIAGEVAKLRGLKLRRPIKRGVMNTKQLEARLLERVHEDYQPEELANEEMAMKRLGLLPVEMSYLDTVIALLKSQIAGFYDPADRKLYLSEESMGGEEVMAHEIDHALQDQHFDLKRWMTAEKKNADATLARQALVEGDGTVLMLEFATDKTGAKNPWADSEFATKSAGAMRAGMVMMGDVPLALKESLVFPYVNGLKFVAHTRATKPWTAIDAMYKRPPLSTEQIVHPEKYDTYELPIDVRATKKTPKALPWFAPGYDNTAGEMTLWLLLVQHGVDQAVAKEAVTGWGGDHVAVYTAPGVYRRFVATSVAVLYTVWDTEPDAVQFEQALTTALPSLAPGGAVATPPAGVTQHTTRPGAIVAIERHGSSVLLVIGPPSTVADALRAEVWQTWTVQRP